MLDLSYLPLTQYGLLTPAARAGDECRAFLLRSAKSGTFTGGHVPALVMPFIHCLEAQVGILTRSSSAISLDVIIQAPFGLKSDRNSTTLGL